MNEETLFQLALEKPPQDRVAFLESACGADAELRYRVERLLLAYENPGSFLQQPALPSTGKTPDEVTQAIDAERANRVEGTRTQPDSNASSDDDLAFLTPSTKPGSLGRLEHYEILEIVGKGGFGTVLKAFDEKLHRVVAIKVLAPDLSASGTARQRFIREARTAAAVVHDHVVTIHAVVEEHRPPYLVMQMIDGATLQQKLDKTGTLSLREVLRIGMQMAQALDAAHRQGLVHRDIKPANVLLENGVERVKITDFGLARAVDDASVTQSGTVAGTPMYMSPEQAEGLPIDHRSDLFSLGTVLYAMCTGHPPFRASGTHAVLKRVIDASPRPIRETNHDIPDWLCDIIAKLHAKKPEDRFQTAKEVAELLGQRLADVQAGRAIERAGSVSDRSELPASVAPTPVAEAPGSPKRRLAFAAIGLLILVAGGLGIAEWIGFTHLFRGPSQYEVIMRVDDLNITLRCSAALENETPEQFAERFREKASRNDFNDFMIANRFDGPRIMLPANTKWWILCERNGKLLYHKLVNVDRPQEVHLPWAAEAARQEQLNPKDEPGWAPLFNKKDTTGWKPHPNWRVENGILVGSGTLSKNSKNAFLVSDRSDFEDFHLRVEARVVTEECDSGVLCRVDYPSWESYHEANIAFNPRRPGEQTGSLGVRKNKKDEPWIAAPSGLAKPNEWFILEVIARGPHVVTKVNGKLAAENQDLTIRTRGHLMLQQFGAQTIVHVKKIEIKELPIPPALAAKAKEHPKPRVVRFDPARDVPIDKDAIEKAADGWKIDFNKVAAYYVRRTFRLFELRDQELENCRVTLRGQIRTVARAGFTPIEASLRFDVYPQVESGLQRFSTRSAELAARGTTNWASYEVSEVFHGRPIVLAVGINVEQRGEVWLKDLELVIEPLPEAQRRPVKDLTPPPTAAPKLVRRWTPDKDAFISLDGVSVDKIGWKVHHNVLYRDTLRLFELKDHKLGPGTLVLKARMSTDVALGYGLKATPFLEFRPPLDSGKNQIKTAEPWTTTQRNENSAWYEARVHATAAPELIAVNLRFEGHGSLWIEEIELLHLPRSD